RDLGTGREMELPAPDLVKTGLTFSADGRVLYFLGARERDPDRTDIFEISELAPKPVLVVDAGGLKSAPIVDPSGRALSSTVPARALSADGRTLAYVARNGAEYALMVGPTTGVQVPAIRTPLPIDAPALSADGGRVAFQRMLQHDWEIFVADRDGGREQRVTRE